MENSEPSAAAPFSELGAESVTGGVDVSSSDINHNYRPDYGRVAGNALGATRINSSVAETDTV